MSFSQAPATIEKPLTLAIQGVASSSCDAMSPGTLHVSELSEGDAPEVLAVLATSYQSPPDHELEALVIERVRSAIAQASGQHASDLLKSGFRDANCAIVETSGVIEPGVAMLAMLTRGKYATMALVGQDRAYLARAGRLNQLTRDQSVAVARSRRKQDAQVLAGSTHVKLLGEAERLESASPAIFEIVLLPEDRLALLSHDLIEIAGEEAIRHRLNVAQSSETFDLVSIMSDGSEPRALMAAVLSAAPAREPVILVSGQTGNRSIWMIVILVLLLIVIFAVVAFLLL